MIDTPGIVIVGAGHGGGSVAAFLRQYGFSGPITLVGDEPLLPYHRPPLSKAWLKAEADGDSLTLKPATWYDGAKVAVMAGTSAVSIDRVSKTIALSTGATVPYDHLVLATGARARRLDIPGIDLAGVLTLRDAQDADRLKAALRPGSRLAVIGGGYVGLEVAASARALGIAVTVIEREPRLLARVASPELAGFFNAYHRDHGVEIVVAADVVAIDGTDGAVAGIVLGDGRTIACDIALVGVGAVPEDQLARDAGLDCVNGITVDLEARTSDPAIFAVGDVTWRPLPHYNQHFRLESVPNAIEQAKQVAAALSGKLAPAHEIPWFWSDQYDLKLQIAGLGLDAERRVVRGDPQSGTFAVFHLAGNRVRAVEAVNAPPEFMAGKQLIARETPVSDTRLADIGCSMKEVGIAAELGSGA